MSRVFSKLTLKFFRTTQGNEPVREWLKSLPQEDRKKIGDEIRTVQLGWPLGMPLVRKLESDLWEIRVTFANRIARVLFTIANGAAVLLHGFIKQGQRTPLSDLRLARASKAMLFLQRGNL